jgi:hypothetical protein
MNDTFDQFVMREDLRELFTMLRSASNQPRARKFERYLVECPRRDNNRFTLAILVESGLRETFVATVAGRGFNGKRRTIVLEDLRLFGCKFVQEDHLWVVHDKQWERIEPFLQGQKVVLVATAIKYSRNDATCDYTLAIEKVVKL